MLWKAGALLVGVAVSLTGLSSWSAERADARDDRRQTLELEASVAAVRVDGAVNRAATTLTLASSEIDLDRLAEVIDAPVCRRGGARPDCAQPVISDEPAEPFAGSHVARAEALATAASRRSGQPGVAVVASSSGSGGTAIVVAVEHTDGRTVALLPLEPGLVVPGRMAHADGDAASAPLATAFANGPWSTVAAAEAHIEAAAGLTWVTVLQILGGASIMMAAIAAMTHDQRRLRRRATIDALTGLPNRAEFERRASGRLTQLGRDGVGGCLIVVDLDGFKSINDSAGHAAGDRVLAEAGRRLAGAVRATDLVGRWGGDEFVLLLGGVSDPLVIPDRTADIAACLSELPADPNTRLTASVGAAAFPLQGRDLATLLDLADRAMYEAKRLNGKLCSVTSSVRSGVAVVPAVPWRP